jgi:cytidine deaminase
MDYSKLVEIARKASENTYSPYSNFPVGASLVTKDGKYYHGCNIENASFGLTNCAERTCMFSAYADGVRKQDIVALCVYSPKEHLVSPCGACRQVMVELLDENCPIILAYEENKSYETTVKDLFPLMFTSEDLEND